MIVVPTIGQDPWGVDLNGCLTDLQDQITRVTLDVVNYGAVGNGVTDDTAAIQDALDAANAAGGGVVVFPPGKTYAITTFLVVYDDTTIWAYGATIKSIGNTGLLRNFTGSETFAGYAGHSHINVFGGTWDANANDGVDGTVTAETDAINFVHCSDITVRDATITNVSSAHALEFNSTDGGRALNCRFLGYRDNAGGTRQFSEALQIDIAVSGSSSIGLFDNTPSKNIIVSGCYFAASPRLGVFGRAVGSHTTASGVYYDNITVIGNQVNGTIQQGIYGFGWRYVDISSNTVTGSGKSGIQVTIPDPVSVGYSLAPTGLTITGNTVDTVADDSGIRALGYSGALLSAVRIDGNTVHPGTGAANGIHMEYCDRPGATGNTVRSSASTGILAQNSTGAQIVGNTVLTSASNGINITDCTGAQVSSNTVDGTTTNHGIFAATSSAVAITANKVNAAASAGIRLSTSATGCMVSANTVRAGGVSVNGVTFASTATGCTVIGNDLSGNAWDASTALSVSTAVPITGPGGMTAIPGSNTVDTDLNPLPSLESAMRPAGRYETTTRLRCGTTSTPTSGTLYLIPVWLPAGKVLSNLSFVSVTGITSPTHWWFMLMDSSRVGVARTADQTSTAWANNTLKTVAIAQTTAGAAATYTTLYNGLYYLGIMYTGTALTIMSEGTMAQQGDVAPAFGAADTGLTTPPTVTAGGFTAAAPTGAAICGYGFAS